MKFFSDNGTNFSGASKELQKALNDVDKDALANKFTSQSTSWNFIPPQSLDMSY